MIYHQVGLDDGIDHPGTLGIVGHADDRRPHRGEVDNRRDAGEVLQDDPSRHERGLAAAGLLRVVAGQAAHVFVGYRGAVVTAQCGLQQHLDRVGDRVEVADVGQGVEAGDPTLAERGLHRGEGVEGIAHAVECTERFPGTRHRFASGSRASRGAPGTLR